MNETTSLPISDRSVVMVTRNQVSSSLDNERIILLLDSGKYYSLDRVGASIWELIQEPRSVVDLRDAVIARYDVGSEECRRSLAEFLGEMAAEGLIEVRDGAL